MGKTVVLSRVQDLAEKHGYLTIFIEASEEISFIRQLFPQLRKILLKLDRIQNVKDYVKTALRTLKSFASAVKVSYGDLEVGMDLDAELGVADSGDLGSDLPELMTAIGAAAAEQQTAIAIIIDETQYLSEDELSSLISAIHRINQKSLPIVMVAAGLPQVLAKMGNAKSYAERLFDFPKVAALPFEDATQALAAPASKAGVVFRDDAIAEVIRVTRGYPYFLQEWGYVSWNKASGPEITINDVYFAHDEAIRRLDESFFRMRLERMTKTEKKYMRAMAELGAGPHRSGEIAIKYGAKVTTLAPARSSLISKGMIYSPSYGDIEFTVPLFDEFMRREMPDGWK